METSKRTCDSTNNEQGKTMPDEDKLESSCGKERAFLAAFAETGVVSYACAAAGCSRQSVYRWRKADPQFEEQFQEAKTVGVELLEFEARRRAKDGVRRVKFYNGKPLRWKNPETGEEEVYVEHEYSDVLLMFLLKAAKPEVYRDDYRIDMKAEVANETKIDYGRMLPTPEAVRTRILALADDIRAREAKTVDDIRAQVEKAKQAHGPTFNRNINTQ